MTLPVDQIEDYLERGVTKCKQAFDAQQYPVFEALEEIQKLCFQFKERLAEPYFSSFTDDSKDQANHKRVMIEGLERIIRSDAPVKQRIDRCKEYVANSDFKTTLEKDMSYTWTSLRWLSEWFTALGRWLFGIESPERDFVLQARQRFFAATIPTPSTTPAASPAASTMPQDPSSSVAPDAEPAAVVPPVAEPSTAKPARVADAPLELAALLDDEVPVLSP